MALVALAATSLALTGIHPAAAAECAALIPQSGGWTTVSELPPDQPDWMAWSQVAVDPRNPDLIYLARKEEPVNGIWRSADGGCNWTNVVDLAIPTWLVHGNDMSDITVGLDGTVYVTVHQNSGFFTSFLESVWVGRDSGTKWERVTAGLPVAESLATDPDLARDFPAAETRLFAAPGDAATVYMVAKSYANGFSIYASNDAGKNWEFRSGNGVGRSPDRWASRRTDQNDTTFTSLAVDPLDPKQIWVGYTQFPGNPNRAVETRLLHSTDGGVTLKEVTEGPNTPLNGGYAIAVQHRPGKPVHLLVVPSLSAQFLYESTDGGQTWVRVPAPFTPMGAVYFGKTPTSIIVVSPANSTPAHVARFHKASSSWLDITPNYVFDQFYGVGHTSFQSSGLNWAGERPTFYTAVLSGTVEIYSGRW